MKPSVFGATQVLQRWYQSHEDIHPGGERQHAERVADAERREEGENERDAGADGRGEDGNRETVPRHDEPQHTSRNQRQPDHSEHLHHRREWHCQTVVSAR